MFDEILIVDTAVSSFNNAALFNPYFFAVGLLSLPLFYIIYLYGRDILTRLQWNKDTGVKIGFWSVVSLVLWLLLFGGNYAVIRDGISSLPLMIAIVLFVSMVYITKQSIKLNYLDFFKTKKSAWGMFLLLFLLAVLSAKPDLYGILLQTSAIFCGIVVGSRLHKNISDLFISTLVFGITTGLILMQPEYFRFGQLGNLTLLHLAGLILTGFFAVTVLVSKYIHAKSKIYESAYIKLKWLCRIIAALALVLFGLTESVPVFVGLLFVLGLSETLTVYHSKQISQMIWKRSWALMIICFGVLIMCPIISCLGVLYLSQFNEKFKIKDFIRLL